LLILCAWQSRLYQQLIEERVRKGVGLWLNAHAGENDTVFAESLGYIGYFSERKIIDFPGLATPRVSQILARGERNYRVVIDQLQPTYLVLRPVEIIQEQLSTASFWQRYEPVFERDVQPELDTYRWLPGRGWFGCDADFIVFKRRPTPGSATDRPTTGANP
jgi:hypothetical protein